MVCRIFNYDCPSAMGLAFGVIGLLDFVVWKVDVTFVGEMDFAD
jgi:hypothetical protein